MPKKKSLDFKTPIFKNKPLVRCENIIYYGNISDKYIIKLEILSKKPLFDTVVSDKISVQLLSTSSELSSRKKVIKKCEKMVFMKLWISLKPGCARLWRNKHNNLL